QQPDEPLAVFHAGGGVVPQGGQVGGQGADLGELGVGERAGGLLAGALVVLFGVGQVAAAGGVGGVPGPLHVGGAQRVGLLGLGLQLGGDLQRGLGGQRGERVQD